MSDYDFDPHFHFCPIGNHEWVCRIQGCTGKMRALPCDPCVA